MREEGWLEEEFRAANKRVQEWPDWKKEIEAKKQSPEGTPTKQSAKAASVNEDGK
jgi:hypothetical protein